MRGYKPQVWRTTLRELRDETGLTQADVAGTLGISPTYFTYIESGRCDPGLWTAYRLAAFYGKPVGELWVEYLGERAEIPLATGSAAG